MIRSLIDIANAFLSYWVATSIKQNYVNPSIAQVGIGLALFCGLYTIVSKIELSRESWTMRHVVCGISGASIGLILANLVILPVYLTTIEPSSAHAAAAACVSICFTLAFSKLFVELEPKIMQAQVVKNATDNTNLVKILDTNILIDSRISKMVKMRFLEGLILIPDFVLDELKKMSDSPDDLKNRKGRHGLQTATKLMAEHDYVVRYESTSTHDVDQALIDLARDTGGRIITADKNLVELAQTKNVAVTNIHELAVAFQPVLMRGERLTVKIIEAGNNPGQGLAHTEDGTLIVVSDAAERIGEEVQIVITRHLQSKLGLMLFGDLC